MTTSGNRTFPYPLHPSVFKLGYERCAWPTQMPLSLLGRTSIGGPVATLGTDELHAMQTTNAQLEASNRGLWQALSTMADFLCHTGRRCEDLQRELEQERSVLPIVADAVEESTLRRLGLVPAPRQKTTPRHRRSRLHGVNVILFAVVLGLVRPLIPAGPVVHHPAVVRVVARRRPGPLTVPAYGYR